MLPWLVRCLEHVWLLQILGISSSQLLLYFSEGLKLGQETSQCARVSGARWSARCRNYGGTTRSAGASSGTARARWPTCWSATFSTRQHEKRLSQHFLARFFGSGHDFNLHLDIDLLSQLLLFVTVQRSPSSLLLGSCHSYCTWYLNAFGVFRRPPWKMAILQTNSPCTGPARTWLSLKPWLLRLTHFVCQKCFCGKESLEAKTLVSFKARFKFKTKAYV